MKRDEIRSGAALSYVIIALNTVFGLIYTPFMLRKLGQSEYGLYMLIGSLVGYISILDFGLHNTIYRFIAKYQSEGDGKRQENFLSTTFVIYGVITLLVLFIGSILGSQLQAIFSNSLTTEEMKIAHTLFAILVFNMAIMLPMGAFQFILRGYGKFIFVNWVSIARIVLRTITLFAVLELGYRSVAIVIIDTVFNVLMGVVYASYCFNILKLKVKWYGFNKKVIGEILNYSIFVFILAIVNQFFWKIGQVSLGIIANTREVAVYALSISLVLYYQELALGISGVFMPKVTELITKGATGEILTDLMIRVGRIQLILLGLVLSGFILLGRPFVLLWAGAEYSQVFWITLMIFIMLTIPMIQTIGGVILQVKNMQAFKAKAYLLMSGLNLVFSIYLGKAIGAIGVGVATAISIMLFQFLVINIYYKVKVGLNIRRFFKETSKGIVPSIIGTIVLGTGTLLLPGSGLAALALKIVLVCLIYMFLVLRFGLNQSEQDMFVRPLWKRIGSILHRSKENLNENER